MATDTDEQLKVLEHEVEETRANLSETLDELQTQIGGTVEDVRNRLQPEEIKREVKEYVRETSAQLARRAAGALRNKTKENPAAVLAAGALVVWPIARLAMKIPLPVYLMGAGVALMRPTSGADPLAGRQAGEMASRVVNRIQEKMQPVVEAGSRMQTAISEAVSDAASTVRNAASGSGSRDAMLDANRVDAFGTVLGSSPVERPGLANGKHGPNPWAMAMIGLGIGASVMSYGPKMLRTTKRGPHIRSARTERPEVRRNKMNVIG
jgi:hypothetical protein